MEERQSHVRPCPSVVHPSRRSGRSPALPYPPGGQGEPITRAISHRNSRCSGQSQFSRWQEGENVTLVVMGVAGFSV